MSIVKPYTFVPGTKARANEVNENFDRLYEQVNANITDIATNATNITNLGIDKANIQGDSTQRFAVADATSSYDAINKQTMMKSISNSLDVISGLVITTDSNSPSNTIIVSAGSCYDSTRTSIMQLTASISKYNDGQVAGANYYVYLIAGENGVNPDILISTSAVTPALPADYIMYRKIGYFTTNSSNAIAEIYYYGFNAEAIAGIANVIKSYVYGDSGYIVYSNGFKIQWGFIGIPAIAGGWDANISFLVPFTTANYAVLDSAWYPEAAGDKVNYYGCIARGTTYMTYRVIQERWANSGHLWWMCIGF